MGEQQGGVEGEATEDRRGCGPGLTTEGGPAGWRRAWPPVTVGPDHCGSGQEAGGPPEGGQTILRCRVGEFLTG